MYQRISSTNSPPCTQHTVERLRSATQFHSGRRRRRRRRSAAGMVERPTTRRRVGFVCQSLRVVCAAKYCSALFALVARISRKRERAVRCANEPNSAPASDTLQNRRRLSVDRGIIFHIANLLRLGYMWTWTRATRRTCIMQTHTNTHTHTLLRVPLHN